MTSCEDQFLTKVNPNEIASDNFWQNLTDTQTGLNAAYASLRNYFVYSFVESSCKADMGWPGYGRPAPTSTSTGINYYYFRFTNSESTIQSKWEADYIGIFRANQVIEALNRLKGTVDQAGWTTQMAQARFLRGLFHFYLHNDFNHGDIIIRDKVPQSLEDFNKGVSPSAEVIAFFRNDLIYAYNNLPSKYTDGAASQGKASKGTAATILGTSYLYENQIDSAKVFFDDVINNPAYGYTLETDMTKMFTTKGEFNSESILEIPYSSTLRSEITAWNENSMSNRLAFYSTNIVGCYVPSWLASAYKYEKMDTLDARNYSVVNSVKKLRGVSLRASAMVSLPEDDQSVYYGGLTVLTGKFGATGYGPSFYKKYTNHDILTSETLLPRGTLYSGKNFIANRLSEVYLNDAECMIKNGNVDSALILINAIRKRWALKLLGPDKNDGHAYDNVNYTTESLMNRLMYLEKPLELSAEGNSLRWNDLRRWGIIKSNLTKLAATKYYFNGYEFLNSASVITRSTISISPDSIPLVYMASGVQKKLLPIVENYEYTISASSYVPESHDYLPIPMSEITSNSALKR